MVYRKRKIKEFARITKIGTHSIWGYWDQRMALKFCSKLIQRWSTVREILTLLRESKSVDVRARVYRIANVHDFCRRPFHFIPIEEVDASDISELKLSGKKPIVFIHGAEYGSVNEVIDDFIIPFFENSGLLENHAASLREDIEVFFVAWNSKLVCHQSHARLHYLLTHLRRPFSMALTATHWRRFFDDVEMRAMAAAELVSPFAKMLLSTSSPKPLVITHSLGGLVWAHLVENLARRGDLPSELGSWWNLQPAIESHAFSKGGRFSNVPRAYAMSRSKLELWYTRLDCVLGFFYFFTKKTWAMGQIGLKKCSSTTLINSVDLTWLAGEAHGAMTLRGGHQKHFLSRVGNYLRMKVREELAPTL